MENERNDRPMHRKARKKVCHFCVDRVETIDYKDVARLCKFISQRAKILPRRAQPAPVPLISASLQPL